MNEMNVISYLLLAGFVAGTSYVTYVTAKEVYNDCKHHFKALMRLLRIGYHARNIWNKVAGVFFQPRLAECCKSGKSTNKNY